jgi:hypothetical protein
MTRPGWTAAALLTLALLGTQARARSSAVSGTVEDPIYIPAGVSDAGTSPTGATRRRFRERRRTRGRRGDEVT